VVRTPATKVTQIDRKNGDGRQLLRAAGYKQGVVIVRKHAIFGRACMSYLTKIAMAFGLAAAVGMAAVSIARADVLRVAIVEADNDADFAGNVALLPTFADLLKKGGAKNITVGSDAEHKTIATSSLWGSAADLAKVTGSDDWKAAAGKLKRKSYTTGVYQVAP
jgi:hypothetical protein